MKINSYEFKNIEKEIGTNFKWFCSLLLLSKDEKPQLKYKNLKNHPYLKNISDETKFCSFKPNLPNDPGLYLWVVNNEIIYIGEAVNLKSRFNSGYGNISPRNCFKGGQSTNVKMNLIAKKIYEAGKKIDIYIFKTNLHKELELILRKKIKTLFNKNKV